MRMGFVIGKSEAKAVKMGFETAVIYLGKRVDEGGLFRRPGQAMNYLGEVGWVYTVNTLRQLGILESFE